MLLFSKLMIGASSFCLISGHGIESIACAVVALYFLLYAKVQ